MTADELIQAYKTDHGLFAQQLIDEHPRAVDYLMQCPLLLTAVASGRVHFGRVATHLHTQADKRVNDIRVWGEHVATGPRLRDLMATYRLQHQFRRLLPGACSAHALWMARLMFTFDDQKIGFTEAELAAIIPTRMTHQKIWASACGQYFHHALQAMLRHGDGDPGFQGLAAPSCRVKWVMRAVSAHPYVRRSCQLGSHEMQELADYIAYARANFNEGWSLKRGFEEVHKWHEQLNAAEQTSEGFLKKNGYALDDGKLTDYAPFPERAEAGGYIFVALNSGAALLEEGRAMRHCVVDYGIDIKRDHSRIFSIREADGIKRVATVQYAQRQLAPGSHTRSPAEVWQINQLKGVKNHRPKDHQAVYQAAMDFVMSIPDVDPNWRSQGESNPPLPE